MIKDTGSKYHGYSIPEEEKDKIKEYERKMYQQFVKYKKEALQKE